MATNFKDISEKVFNLLKGHGFDLKTFNKEGKIVIDPQEGTRFVSDEPNILVRIDDMEKEISLQTSEDFADHNLRNLLKELAQDSLLSFDFRVFDKKLKPKGEEIDVARRQEIDMNEEINKIRKLSGLESIEMLSEAEFWYVQDELFPLFENDATLAGPFTVASKMGQNIKNLKNKFLSKFGHKDSGRRSISGQVLRKAQDIGNRMFDQFIQWKARNYPGQSIEDQTGEEILQYIESELGMEKFKQWPGSKKVLPYLQNFKNKYLPRGGEKTVFSRLALAYNQDEIGDAGIKHLNKKNENTKDPAPEGEDCMKCDGTGYKDGDMKSNKSCEECDGEGKDDGYFGGVKSSDKMMSYNEEEEIDEWVSVAARGGLKVLGQIFKQGAKRPITTTIAVDAVDDGELDTTANAIKWLTGKVGDVMVPDAIKKAGPIIAKYGIPAAGVVAAIYGGKKLIDYMKGSENNQTVSQNNAQMINADYEDVGIEEAVDKEGMPLNPDGSPLRHAEFYDWARKQGLERDITINTMYSQYVARNKKKEESKKPAVPYSKSVEKDLADKMLKSKGPKHKVDKKSKDETPYDRYMRHMDSLKNEADIDDRPSLDTDLPRNYFDKLRAVKKTVFKKYGDTERVRNILSRLNDEEKINGAKADPNNIMTKVQLHLGESITEASLGKMTGSRKSSYQPLADSVKIIVRHNKEVNEEVRGARSRNIHSILIQRGEEKFKMAENNLSAARAMARHLHNGGETFDEIGEAITEMSREFKKLKEFVQYVRKAKLVNETNEEFVTMALENINNIKVNFKRLSGVKTYANAVENVKAYNNVEMLQDDLDLESKFTETHFDDKVANVMDSLKAMASRKQSFENKIVKAIESETFANIKDLLSENDIVDFDTPHGKLGHQVSQLGYSAQDHTLSNYLHSISNKINAGGQLNQFEYGTIKSCLLSAGQHNVSNAPMNVEESYEAFMDQFVE